MTVLESLQALAERFAVLTGMTPRSAWFLAAMIVALTGGTVIRIIWRAFHPTPQATRLLDSLKTWWALIVVLVAAVSLGRTGLALAFGVLSYLALGEFMRVQPPELAPRAVRAFAYLLIPFQYLAIWLNWEPLFFVFVPLATMIVLPAVRMASASTQGFWASVGVVQWSLLISVYGLSHAACFPTLPESSNPVGGAAGWLLFLLVMTEANDMAQALTGRAFGRRKATPKLSPNKTWEGFFGGGATSILLAILLAPWITPLARAPERWGDSPWLNIPFFPAVLAGTIIALGGIVGDLMMSACKRDRGVKDFGTLLPGHGGVLDRFDSLTITAPLFFHFVRFLDY
jgi:phosphatidate cytidylyltransferase